MIVMRREWYERRPHVDQAMPSTAHKRPPLAIFQALDLKTVKLEAKNSKDQSSHTSNE
jgi:hypothetical protein